MLKKSLILAFVMGCFLGCATSEKPLFDVDEEGNVVLMKRYAKHMEIDFLHRWARTAYVKNEDALDLDALHEEMTEILDRYGEPDYVRKLFLSTWGDKVEEWAYWDFGIVFQFVRGNVVFVGALSDLEKILITNGYPNYVREHEYNDGSRSRSLVYENWIKLGKKVFFLKDDALVYQTHLE